MFKKKSQHTVRGLYDRFRSSVTILCISAWFGLASCDSGDIYPPDPASEKGISTEATFRFLHTEAWPVSYDVLLGIFNNHSDVPLVSKTLVKPLDGKPATVAISGVPEGAVSIRLCLSKSGRKTFYTWYEMALNGTPTEDVIISEQTIDLLQYGRIQEQIFGQCIACHGGADRAGANLYLTPDRSWHNLINVPAVNSVKKRVEPTNIAGSYLIDVLTEEQANVSYPHSTGISSLKEDDLTLLKEWIRNMNGNQQ